MNPLKLATALLVLCIASAFAAPRDRIDPKDFKDKVSLKLGDKGTIQFKQQGDVLTEPKLTKQADENNPGMGVDFSKDNQQIRLRSLLKYP